MRKSALPVVAVAAVVTIVISGTAAVASASPVPGSTCSASDVTGTLGRVEAGAGQRGALLTLSAKPGNDCTVSGFPLDPHFVDGAGKVLPTRTDEEQNGSTSAVNVTGSRHAQLPLRWTGIPVTENDDPDAPAPAALRFTLAGLDGPITVNWTGGQVFNGGHLITNAVRSDD